MRHLDKIKPRQKGREVACALVLSLMCPWAVGSSRAKAVAVCTVLAGPWGLAQGCHLVGTVRGHSAGVTISTHAAAQEVRHSEEGRPAAARMQGKASQLPS